MALFRTVIHLEILSVGPVPDETDLAVITYQMDQGDYSGMVIDSSSEEVTRERMAELLIAQGSDPEFLLGEEDVYEYTDQASCVAAGQHLQSTDDDGYCNRCGHGPDGETNDDDTTVGVDEEPTGMHVLCAQGNHTGHDWDPAGCTCPCHDAPSAS
ncbi:hypothetical protein [Tessaracoccus sp.]